jgi:hypothetical protein
LYSMHTKDSELAALIAEQVTEKKRWFTITEYPIVVTVLKSSSWIIRWLMLVWLKIHAWFWAIWISCWRRLSHRDSREPMVFD